MAQEKILGKQLNTTDVAIEIAVNPLAMDAINPVVDISESQVNDLQAYLLNVVEDLTPQLGGDLDTNGNNIHVSDGLGNHVALAAPTFAGSPPANVTYVLPELDGTVGQVLSTDGSGNLGFITAAGGGGGLDNVVEDLSPQLGAKLDTNNFDIGPATYGVDLTIDTAVAGFIGGSGNITIQTGTTAGEAATGAINITGSTSGATGYAAGLVDIKGGANTSSGLGGAVQITAGATTGNTSYGGNVTITGGANSAVDGGYGGYVNIAGGAGYYGGGVFISTPNNANRDVGRIRLQAGNNTYSAGYGAGYSGGDIQLTAGDSLDGQAGSIKLEVGQNNTGAAYDGSIDCLANARPVIVRLSDANGSFSTITTAPTLAADTTFTLPPTDGSAGHVLTTNGSGDTSWDNIPVATPYLKAALPAVGTAGGYIYVSDATGASLTGSLCFSNGSVWVDTTTGAAVA